MRKQLKSLFQQYGIKKNKIMAKKTEAEPRKKIKCTIKHQNDGKKKLSRNPEKKV